MKVENTLAAWLKEQIRREIASLPDSCCGDECTDALKGVEEAMDYLIRLGEEYRMYERETRL